MYSHWIFPKLILKFSISLHIFFLAVLHGQYISLVCIQEKEAINHDLIEVYKLF